MAADGHKNPKHQEVIYWATTFAFVRQPLHILFLPRWYPDRFDRQNGVFIRKHAEAVALRHRVSLVYAYGDPELTELKIEVRDEASFREICVGFPKGDNRVLNAPRYAKAIERGLEELIPEWGKPDLIHAHVLLRTALMAERLSKRWKAPWLLTEHWTGYLSGVYKGLPYPKRALFKRALKQAAHITVVGPSIRDAIATICGHDRLSIVANVVEAVEVESPKSDVIEILNVSDLRNEVKNVSGLIRAFDEVAQGRSDLRLRIIGGGADEQKLHQLASSLESRDKIIFEGMLINDRVLEYMNRCSFYITNSNVETFSVATAEAMLAGKPVICTRSGGPEHFVTPECGLVIEKGNHKLLVQAMKQMIDSLDQYDSEQIKSVVSDSFSREAIGNAFDQVYQKVLNR